MRMNSEPLELVLVLGDIHAPYHHQDTLSFIHEMAKNFGYDPENPRHLTVSIGDEADGHGWSFHDKDPALHSPGEEFRQARTFFKLLERLMPNLVVLESNHGSLHIRKQKHHGLPRGFFKDYNEAWDVPGWTWVYDLTVKLSNGSHTYFHHGLSTNVLKVSQSMGMNVVQGHHHQLFGVQYWRNSFDTFWGAQTGCLIDHESLAFAYGKNNLKKPLLGSLAIVKGYPIPVPMVLKNGRWLGRLV